VAFCEMESGAAVRASATSALRSIRYASTGAILGYFVSSAGSRHAVPSATNSVQLVDANVLRAFRITHASCDLPFVYDRNPWPKPSPYCERSVSDALTLAARAA